MILFLLPGVGRGHAELVEGIVHFPLRRGEHLAVDNVPHVLGTAVIELRYVLRRAREGKVLHEGPLQALHLSQGKFPAVDFILQKFHEL